MGKAARYFLRGLRQFEVLFRRSVMTAYQHGAFGVAKGVAYSGLLTFFPLLATVGALLVHANAERVSQMIAGFLFRVVPPGSAEMVRYQFLTRGSRPLSFLFLAGFVTLVAGSGMMCSLIDGFNAAYHVKQGRSFWRQRLVAVGLVLLTVGPSLAAAGIIVFGNRVERLVIGVLGLAPAGAELSRGVAFAADLLRYLVGAGTFVLVASLLFRMAPHCPLKFRDVWPGALLAGGLWLLTTSGFAWYVSNIADYNYLYGTIGAVIALLVWLYLLAVMTLISCEYNANRKRLKEAHLGARRAVSRR